MYILSWCCLGVMKDIYIYVCVYIHVYVYIYVYILGTVLQHRRFIGLNGKNTAMTRKVGSRSDTRYT